MQIHFLFLLVPMTHSFISYFALFLRFLAVCNIIFPSKPKAKKNKQCKNKFIYTSQVNFLIKF